MSKDCIFEMLAKLGFTKTEAKVYIYLLGAEHPKKRIEITEALKIRSQQLYHILNNLKDKHVIKNSSEPTCSFSAVPIEEALDMLIETKKKQQKALKTTKKELLSIWQATIEKD